MGRCLNMRSILRRSGCREPRRKRSTGALRVGIVRRAYACGLVISERWLPRNDGGNREWRSSMFHCKSEVMVVRDKALTSSDAFFLVDEAPTFFEHRLHVGPMGVDDLPAPVE